MNASNNHPLSDLNWPFAPTDDLASNGMLTLIQAQNDWLATVGFVPPAPNPVDLLPIEDTHEDRP